MPPLLQLPPPRLVLFGFLSSQEPRVQGFGDWRPLGGGGEGQALKSAVLPSTTLSGGRGGRPRPWSVVTESGSLVLGFWPLKRPHYVNWACHSFLWASVSPSAQRACITLRGLLGASDETRIGRAAEIESGPAACLAGPKCKKKMWGPRIKNHRFRLVIVER